MPRYSERAKTIWTLSRCADKLRLHLIHENDEGIAADLEDVDDALETVMENRYLNRAKEPEDRRHRDSYQHCVRLMDANEDDFRRSFRLTKSQFWQLVKEIKGDDIFRGNPRRKQRPVEHQVLVALWRFAHSGTGASCFHIAERFGISEGSVIVWTDRVLCALISLEKKYVWWPSRGERAQIRRQMREERGLLGHHTYSFNVLGVVDFQRRFRFLHLGYPGSAHDQRVFTASALSGRPEDHFDDDDYVLGDSGYTSGKHLVALYKRYRGQENLDPSQVKFNHHAASSRVAVEHAFGMLKLRWQSLRSLRLAVRDRFEEGRAACWIRACVVLHNMLVDGNADPDLWLTAEERSEAITEHGHAFQLWEQHGDPEDGERDDEDTAGAVTADRAGAALRVRVQTFAATWQQEQQRIMEE
ncbi:hypothetical protein CF326_g7757 [Tilletia indica]|nr:hypothetical protein CF326_g7757 [Tilletia indica]